MSKATSRATISDAAAAVGEPWPTVLRDACLAYRSCLQKVKGRFYRDTPPIPSPIHRKGTVWNRLRRGAEHETHCLVWQVASDPALAAVCENRPLKLRTTPTAANVPCWTTTPASPIGLSSRKYKELNRAALLDWLEKADYELVHTLLKHESLPQTAHPDEVWTSMLLLRKRLTELLQWGRTEQIWTGGFVSWEVSPVWYDGKRGVLVHAHLAARLRKLRSKARVDAEWQRSAATHGGLSEAVRSRTIRIGKNASNLVLYAAGTKLIDGTRYNKILDSVAVIERKDSDESSHAPSKSRSSPEQLRLALAGIAFPHFQIGYFGDLDARTVEGKELRRRIKD